MTKLRAAIIILVNVLAIEAELQHFTKEPSDIRIGIGANITLPCQIHGDEIGRVQWSLNGWIMGKDTEGFLRHKMTYDEENGIYDLFIFNVRKSDEGFYECQAGPTKKSSELRSRANLNVKSPPNYIVLSGSTVANEGSVMQFTCTTNLTSPESLIHWKFDDSHKSFTQKTVKHSNFLQSIITFMVSKEDNQKKLSCEIFQDDLNWTDKLYRFVELDVNYPPSVIELQVQPKVLTVGVRAKFTCKASLSNPRVSSLQWYINNNAIISDDRSEYLPVMNKEWTVSTLTLTITKNMHQKYISCMAVRSNGQDETEMILSIEHTDSINDAFNSVPSENSSISISETSTDASDFISKLMNKLDTLEKIVVCFAAILPIILILYNIIALFVICCCKCQYKKKIMVSESYA